jgi:hypothetical protein
MEKTFFVLYGAGGAELNVRAMDVTEIVEGARELDSGFNPEAIKYSEVLDAAEKIWMKNYRVFGMYDYDLMGMSEFLKEAFFAGELVHLSALQLAQNFVHTAQRFVNLGVTDAQKKVIDRVTFPLAGNEKAFERYQEKIAEIRGKSINALYEYVKNGDETPE